MFLSVAFTVPVFDETAKIEQRPEDLKTAPDVTSEQVPTPDVSSPRFETIQASTPAEKPTPKMSYEAAEGELRTTTDETESQETTDDGRTITRRVKTSRYYQPLIHRTLVDGVVVNETSEDVLVGSYVDEYCYDAPSDLVDVHSASVETQTSVDETEQTLTDGTWLRHKVTRVTAYLAVDDEPQQSVPNARTEPSKPAAETVEPLAGPPADLKHGDELDQEIKTDIGLQKNTPDGGPESKEFAAGKVERANDQVTLESVEKPVDTTPHLETEKPQLESEHRSVPATEQTDSRDLTQKVEPSSAVIEAEPECGKDQVAVVSRDEQITAEVVTPGKRSTTVEEKEPMPVTEDLIMAVPNARQNRTRPVITAEPLTSSFDEPETFPLGEQLIEEQPIAEQFASPCRDLEPVSEETIAPTFRASREPATLDTTKLDAGSTEIASLRVNKKPEPTEEQCAIPLAAVTKIDDSVSKRTHDSATDVGEAEVTPVSEELIMAVPNPRLERARPPITVAPITISFDEPEELIEECPAVEQFSAAPAYESKPVEEDVIAPSIRPPKEPIKDVPTAKLDYIQSESAPVTAEQQDLAKPTPHSTTVEQIPDTVLDSKDSTTEAVPVTEELITAVPNTRQECLPRSSVVTMPITSSFDEPEDLLPDEQPIEEQQTAQHYSSRAFDLKPAEEELIAADIRPPRSRDTTILDNGIVLPKAVDRTSFVPVEGIKAAPETVQHQPCSIDKKAVPTVDQARTRPVLVLKSESDAKPAGPGASTFVSTLPPRQPRRPHSATEMTPRRHGIESPQPGVSSKPRMRRESPLSFVDRRGHAASPTSPSFEDFDSPVFYDGCRQVKTRSKKLITRKVRKVRHDGEVVEDIVTEEVPDYGYSETSSVRSGQSPAVISPRTASVSSLTPVEPRSPGGDSLSSQSSLRVFTDTVEGEPEVVTDVQEREETLPDGRVVIRKIIRTRQKQTIVKRTVMEGPPADDEQPTEVSGQLAVAAGGEDIQKPNIRTYSDAVDMRPSTETVSKDVEEVLPDGTVQRKLTTMTSTRQLKTERTVIEGPYVPETVNQALQGDVCRLDETAAAALPQSPTSSLSASRPMSTTSKTSGSSRTSPRPKFRIAMESPTPPATAAADNGGTPPSKTTDSSKPTDSQRSQSDQS